MIGNLLGDIPGGYKVSKYCFYNGKTKERHIKRPRKVLKRLKKSSLKLARKHGSKLTNVDQVRTYLGFCQMHLVC